MGWQIGDRWVVNWEIGNVCGYGMGGVELGDGWDVGSGMVGVWYGVAALLRDCPRYIFSINKSMTGTSLDRQPQNPLYIKQ